MLVKTELDQEKLKKLEGDFFLRYPKGFHDPNMLAMVKKHNVEKITALCQEYFTKRACHNIHLTTENMIKIINRSSMISMFEKPKFRDFINHLSDNEKAFLVNGLYQFLHTKQQQKGFEVLLDMLKTAKLAKWSLLTVIAAYFAPTTEIFIKPTTVKGILKHFDISDPVYHPTPCWEFYEKYRRAITIAKRVVNTDLSPSNIAFSGFLRMTIQNH